MTDGNQSLSEQRILIVDDDKFLLDMYAIKFNEKGFDVHTAMSGDEALEKLNSDEFKPEVVLLDIVMPGKSGFEVLEEVKKDKVVGERTTVIVLSNLGQKEDIDKGLELGADGYIVKASATPSEVVVKVGEIVDNKKKS